MIKDMILTKAEDAQAAALVTRMRDAIAAQSITPPALLTAVFTVMVGTILAAPKPVRKTILGAVLLSLCLYLDLDPMQWAIDEAQACRNLAAVREALPDALKRALER